MQGHRGLSRRPPGRSYDPEHAQGAAPRSIDRGSAPPRGVRGACRTRRSSRLSQMARAVAHSGFDHRDGPRESFPLLQSQAVAHARAARAPVTRSRPCRRRTYVYTEGAPRSRSSSTTQIGHPRRAPGASRRTPAQIALLSSPDHAVVEKAAGPASARPPGRTFRQEPRRVAGVVEPATGPRGAPRPRCREPKGR